MNVTRHPEGVSTSATTESMFSQFAYPDPTKYFQYFNDFATYVAGDWTVTETNSSATQALTDGAMGLLLITNTATENDLVSMQKLPEDVKLVSGKQTFFECRFKLGDATQSDILFGLAVTNTDPFGSPPADGIWFQKLDGSTSVDLKSLKDSSGTTVSAVTTLSNDTFVQLGFWFDGADLHIYVDQEKVSKTAAITYCDDEELRLTMSMQTGSAGAKTMTVDYLLVAQER